MQASCSMFISLLSVFRTLSPPIMRLMLKFKNSTSDTRKADIQINVCYVRNWLMSDSSIRSILQQFQIFLTSASCRVSSPGEFHPEALAEPSVNLSIHWAPIIQPEKVQPTASEQTDTDYVLQLVLASVSLAECTLPFSCTST